MHCRDRHTSLNTKRAALPPPPRTLYVCVCVREAEAEEGVRVQTCTPPPSARRFYNEHVTLLKGTHHKAFLKIHILAHRASGCIWKFAHPHLGLRWSCGSTGGGLSNSRPHNTPLEPLGTSHKDWSAQPASLSSDYPGWLREGRGRQFGDCRVSGGHGDRPEVEAPCREEASAALREHLPTSFRDAGSPSSPFPLRLPRQASASAYSL